MTCIPKAFQASTTNYKVISNREDGLGERINCILNGIILAHYFDLEFGYHWKDQISHQGLKKTSALPNLVGHAILADDLIFSGEFKSAYNISLEQIKNLNLSEITGSGLKTEEISKILTTRKSDGIKAPRLLLHELFQDAHKILNKLNYQEAFKKIKFSTEIENIINIAKKQNHKKYIALHLRSGDVFYGEYRKYIHYTYKGIVTPIAKQIIKHFQSLGHNILLLGQDKNTIKNLQQEYKTLSIDDFNSENKKFNTTEQAFFELMLMSNAEDIVAGTSGYAKLAAAIGGKRVINPVTLFDHQKQTSIIISDLEINKQNYHPLHVSFSYWYAYYYGRKSKNIETISFLLKKAIEFDFENYTYSIVLASELYKNNLLEEGNVVIEELFSNPRFKRSELEHILRSKTAGIFNLKEYYTNFYNPRVESENVKLIKNIIETKIT